MFERSSRAFGFPRPALAVHAWRVASCSLQVPIHGGEGFDFSLFSTSAFFHYGIVHIIVVILEFAASSANRWKIRRRWVPSTHGLRSWRRWPGWPTRKDSRHGREGQIVGGVAQRIGRYKSLRLGSNRPGGVGRWYEIG